MPSTNAKQGDTVTRNDGGTVINAGTQATGSRITKVVAVKDINGAVDYEYGSQVFEKTNTDNDSAGQQKAKSGGTFAYTPARGERNFLVRGLTDKDGGGGKINNSAASTLVSGGSEYASVGTRQVNTVHDSTGNNRYHLTGFDLYAKSTSGSKAINPARSRGGSAGAATNWTDTLDKTSSAADSNNPTARSAVPGELVYMQGNPTPEQDDYRRRDVRES